MTRNCIPVFAALALLAACADESRAPPVSTDSSRIMPSSQMPQSPNSLPQGSAVNAPLTGRAGDVSTVRVGPR